ncbi:M23 family metallopeptidase [Clostridium sp.]|uniref:M23 family metallopeptidase n=1 Tax=Clostridium sp. TaxID=1506 RepID=UPI001A4DF0DB|nr:M23 family metallopeptidase [Clostridium sp.]MBK5240181.1 M23 family metallopeptidase [Clostridium sp.]
MDKKSNNKTLNFFKKEGFYVILFVCLCIVATVASISASNNKKEVASNQLETQKQQENETKVLKEEEKKYQDALQVKKENEAKTQVLKSVPNIQKVTTTNSTAPVSKTISVEFEKPVAKGLLARAYSVDVDAALWTTTGSYSNNLGIDISVKIGEPVLAVMAGKVKKVGTDLTNQKGQMVEIDHGNGFVTRYSNLDAKILVKENDTVTKNQKIGIVGDTTLNSFSEEYGPHLHFEVLKNSKNVDPAIYVTYEKYQAVENKE